MRKPINVAEDIVPIGQFKTHASELLRQMHATGRPLVITQSGRPSAVVLTPEEFEELGYREYVKAKIKAGVESGRRKAFSASAVRKRLVSRIRATARED